jgi:CHAT domain-containing protein
MRGGLAIFCCGRRSVLRQKPLIVASVALLLLGCSSHRLHDPRRILAEADRLTLLYNWPEAAPLYAQAETLFRRSGDTRNAVYARLGFVWATADTGVTAAVKSEVDRDLLAPMVRSDPPLMLRCLVTKAALEREVNESSARDDWEQILSLARAASDERWRARAEAELGEIMYMDGDVKAAVRMFKQAILSQYSHGDFGAAIYYSSIVGNGLVEAGEPETGLRYCNLAARESSLVRGAGFPFLAYQGKARALIALHRYAQAQGVLEEALRRARAEGNRSAETQLLIVAGDGAKEHNPGQAIQYLKAANALSQSGGFYHAYAWSALELARVYRDRGDLAPAEEYATRALSAMRDLGDKYHLPQHVALLADLKASRGKLEEADRLYEQASDLIDSLLINVPSQQIESSLISTLSNVYLSHFDLTAERLHDTAKAYEVIEEARGRSLADALRGERSREPPADRMTTSAQEEINRIQLALLHETDRGRRQDLLERLFEAEQVFTPVSGPATPLRSAARRVRPIPLAMLQSHLLPNEMVLEYVLDEPRSFCIRITRTHATVAILQEGRGRIEQTVGEYLTEIRARKPASELGQQLYAELLQPNLTHDDKSRLIVVPDGKLNFLPFDSLIDGAGHRVLDSHVVTYCPSGTVLSLMRSSAVTHPPELRFLGVGGVQYDGVGKSRAGSESATTSFLGLQAARLGNIPDTRDEVIIANQALGGKSRLLLGSDATEAAVKSQPLGDFAIIHIAAHGVASSEFPDRAALVLSPDPKGHEDGLLQAREIRNLSLDAQLVTLSACDTGVGSLEGEEGVANLVQAFLFAGARSVVASLWTASDIYTTHLMGRFYAHLASGEDRGSALQHAKIDSIRDSGGIAVPFYWAGFVMVGDGSGCMAGSNRPFEVREARHDHVPATEPARRVRLDRRQTQSTALSCRGSSAAQ